MPEPIYVSHLCYHDRSLGYCDEEYDVTDGDSGMWLCHYYVIKFLKEELLQKRLITLNVYDQPKEGCFKVRVTDGGSRIHLPIEVSPTLNFTVTDIARELNLIDKDLYVEFV